VRRTGSVAPTWGTVVARIVGRSKPLSLPISPHDRNMSTHAPARVSLQVSDGGAFTLTTLRSAVRRLLAWPDINATADDGDAMASTSTCTLLATASIRFVSFKIAFLAGTHPLLFCLRGLFLAPSLSSEITSLPITTLSHRRSHGAKPSLNNCVREQKESLTAGAAGWALGWASWPGTQAFLNGRCVSRCALEQYADLIN
jgi:hypothetical protein